MLNVVLGFPTYTGGGAVRRLARHARSDGGEGCHQEDGSVGGVSVVLLLEAEEKVGRVRPPETGTMVVESTILLWLVW